MKYVGKLFAVIVCLVLGYMLWTGMQGVIESQSLMPAGVGIVSFALTMSICYIMLVVDALLALYFLFLA